MGKSTPNWCTFSRFPGNLAYKNGWLLRLWFCKLFPVCKGPHKMVFLLWVSFFQSQYTCLNFLSVEFSPKNVHFVVLPPPPRPLFPPLRRHRFHRRWHFHRHCWHLPSSPAWAKNGGSRRHGKVHGAGEWSIAWKGPLQRLDITIFDDILFKQMAYFFAPHIRFVEFNKITWGNQNKNQKIPSEKSGVVVSSAYLWPLNSG